MFNVIERATFVQVLLLVGVVLLFTYFANFSHNFSPSPLPLTKVTKQTIRKCKSIAYKVKYDYHGNTMHRLPSNVSSCGSNLKQQHPAQLHLVMIASLNIRKDLEPVGNLTAMMEKYATFHGYSFQFVNPSHVLAKEPYSSMHIARRRSDVIKTMKSAAILDHFEYHTRHRGCFAEDNWIIYFDADVIVTDPSFQLIKHVNEKMHCSDQRNTCHAIAQLSPSTINTGILFFRHSRISFDIIRDWMALTVQKMQAKIDWQHDQGWFQYLYLQHVQQQKNVTLPWNCGQSLMNRALFRGLWIVQVRARCFMKMIKLLRAITPSVSTFPFCVVPGYDRIERFNLHDWPGDDLVVEESHEYRLMLPKNMSTPNCQYLVPSFYHHKKHETMQTLVHHSEQFYEYKLDSKGGSQSKHHDECDEVMRQEIDYIADDMSWVPSSWKSNLTKFNV